MRSFQFTLNRSSIFTWISVLLASLYVSIAGAGLPINTIDETTHVNAGTQFEYFKDTDDTHSFESVITLADEQWTTAESSSVSFGYTNTPFWLRLHVSNAEMNTKDIAFEIAYTHLDDVSFYVMRQDGVVRLLDIGDSKPFYPRDIDHPSMLLRFQLHEGEGVDIYARVQTKGALILPLKIWHENHFFEFAVKEQKLHFFFYGALAVIILINIAIFITLREKLYLYYSFATTGLMLYFFTSRGYGQQLLFPDVPAINSQLFISSIPFLTLFSLFFAREFLQTKHHSWKMDLALRCGIIFECINLMGTFFLDYNISVRITAITAMPIAIMLIFAGPIAWHAKRRAGIFYTAAWIPLTLGVVITVGRTSGLMPNNFLTEYAMQLGSGLEALILTLALADRLYREREDKIIAQAASLQKEQQRLESQSQLSEAMMRDPVTNLANRSRFELLVNQTFNEYPDERFIVCVTRVTRIHEITRTLGLSSAERILKLMADRLNRVIGKMPGVVVSRSTQGTTDATFHLTEDTCGVLIRQTISEKNLEAYGVYIQELLLPVEIDSLSIELDPLVGCALYPAHGRDAAELIRHAHVAMENSHHTANQIGYYDPKLDIYNESRLTLMSELKEALSHNEPTLYYQPKVSLSDNSIVGLEALIRWQHSTLGFVSPDEFVPLAEETGIINQLTLWVIERAAQDLLWLRGRGYSGNLSINISAKDLLSKSLKESISNIIKKYQVDPSKIFLELTETAAMDEPEAGLAALKELASLGLKISIDDFGAGYSSLSYLKQLPASEIKLDRSLIVDITRSESSRIIVKASIDMAHGLGYKVVAEGVEDIDTFLLLKELGCDKLQGFWLCKAKSLEEMGDWLSSRQN